MLSRMRLCVPTPKMESSRPSSLSLGLLEREEVESPIRLEESEFEESGAGAFMMSISLRF